MDLDKNTLLHFAAARGNVEEVTAGINNGQKLDVGNYLEWTPLMMAVRNGHYLIVKLLLDRRADATRKNKFGMSVFLMAVASGDLELIHLIMTHLLQGGVSQQSMESMFSPISLAVILNHVPVWQHLVEQSFNINAATSVTGITPIMFAAALQNMEAFNFMISRGANASHKNVNGQSAHDITLFRQRSAKSLQLQHLPPPLYLVNSPTPYINLSPIPEQVRRKCSDLSSPACFISPNITPITPQNYFHHQVFFPNNFSPNCIVSPMGNVFHSNDFLNARMTNNQFVSPFHSFLAYQ